MSLQGFNLTISNTTANKQVEASMIKFIGIFFMFLSAMALERGFSLSLALWFLFGLFLVCSQSIFGYILFIQREKVRAQYRRRR